VKRLAAAASLIKANFNPDEPHVPKGNPDGGEWTAGGAGITSDTGTPFHDSIEGDGHDRKNRNVYGSDGTGQATSAASTDGAGDGLLPAAYQGDYHDVVVQALKDYLIQKDAKVATSVTLNAINGVSAVADTIVKLPGSAPFVIEVKTGPGAQFTHSQMIVYPMAQIGGHVSSPSSALKNVGLTPGALLPPFDIYIYWVRTPGELGEFIKLPPPELVP